MYSENDDDNDDDDDWYNVQFKDTMSSMCT